MEEMVVVTPEKLEKLMKQKLEAAGLHSEHAEEVARHLTFADASGIHSHGAVRMDYYAERIAKGGVIAGRYRIMLKKQRNKAWLLFRCVNLIQWWYRLVVQAIILGQIQSLLQHLEQVMNQSCLIWLRQYRRGGKF